MMTTAPSTSYYNSIGMCCIVERDNTYNTNNTGDSTELSLDYHHTKHINKKTQSRLRSPVAEYFGILSAS